MNPVLGYEDSTKYLGRKVCFNEPQECELSNRVAVAWGAFSRHKQELTDRRHKIKDRLKLFDAVITSTMLYGCESWTLRVDQRRQLQSVQRKMLRMVLNAKRWTVSADSSNEPSGGDETESKDESETQVLEPWPDFLKRTVKWTEEQLEKAGVDEWIAIWRARKWRWAAKVAAVDNQKWSAVATWWQPLLHSSCQRGRRQARPKKRWEQDFIDYLSEAYPQEVRPWYEVAGDQERWLARVEEFAVSL